MNQEIKLSREKRLALNELIAAIRISQNASDIMDETYVTLLGINRTDGRCLDIVQRLGRITAGELARHSGLTTGAVTAVIDRLERAGYLRRVRDTADRRKVFLQLTDLANTLADIVYAQIGELGGEGMANMSVEHMELISRFLRTSAGMNMTLSQILGDYVDARATGPAERLLAARNFAARIAREREALADEMMKAWNDLDPDKRPGTI